MNVIKTFFGFVFLVFVGFALGLFIGGYLVAFVDASSLENDQKVYYKETGKYFYDTKNKGYQVFTYEELCRGFYTVEEKKDKIVYTGYGDLADKFTYETDIPVDTLPTFTP